MLDRRGTRELAYVLAYVVVVSDQELAPDESSLLRELERTLAISPERASELVYRAARIVTPGEQRDDQPTQQ